MKIKSLTPEQEAYLPIFREEYFNQHVGFRADRGNLEAAISDAYAEIDQPAPQVVILQSPLQAMLAIKVIKTLKAGPMVELQDQLGGQLRDQLRDQLLGKIPADFYRSNYLWGSQDLYWIAWGKFAEHIGVEFPEDVSRRLDIMKRISFECEWWWPYEGICFVSERPVETKWQDKLLHCEDGPAVAYEDGFSLYSWRGTSIPKEWIEDKASLTPDMAITWKSVEQRRCIAEILGWHNILNDERLGAKTIDKDDDPAIGELIEVNIPEIGQERFLKVVCGTGRDFALPVPPDTKTALEAQAWLNFCTVEDIVNLEFRT